MGCEYGKPQVLSLSPEEPEQEFTGFNEAQIDTIRSTWPLLSAEGSRIGAEIFIRIFRESPSIHDLFHHFQIHKVEDLYHSRVFREHSGRFMAVIQSLVDHLECPGDLDQELLVLGAKHATFQGYHPEYFRFYTKCMMDVWEVELGEEFILEVRDSWRLVFEYVVDRMTEGFDMCLGGQIHDVLDGSLSSASSPSSSPAPMKAALKISSSSSAPSSAKRRPSASSLNVKETSTSLPSTPVMTRIAPEGHLAVVDDRVVSVL